MNGRWTVDATAQTAFADLSGDHNPLHVDPLAARRLPFGRVAVHGMHLLLDALDRVAAVTDRTFTRVRCTFRHPVGVDDEIVTRIELGDTAATVRVTTDVWTAADVTVDLGGHPTERSSVHDPSERGQGIPAAAHDAPAVHTLDELIRAEGTGGTLTVAVGADATARRFPALAARVGLGTVAELVTLTRLVGMHVPGLHSLFSGLDVTIGDATTGDVTLEREIAYEIAAVDPRFARVTIGVRGPTLAGTLAAFVRPAPVDQELGDVRPAPDEFAGQRWLVVGGSRGLGAMAVRLLVAGGADVRLTYHRGAADAAAVAGDTATAHRLDVLSPGPALAAITADGWVPTHLAYFATPPIFQGASGVYSPALRAGFDAVYVDAFALIVDRLGADRLTGILWPSSEAAGEPVAGLAEYADAKRAGEALCRDLAAAHPDLTVHAPRLPRLLTDQSTSFVPVEFGDTATELLQALRATTITTTPHP